MRLKSFILTITLSLFALSGLLAQDKYEYATLVKFSSTITFSTENEEVVQVKAKEPVREVLKKLNELSDKGWEVYNTTEANGATTYYLRKKKN